MGRGRQKAKNTKVARELKYYSPATDYNALEAELATGAKSLTTKTSGRTFTRMSLQLMTTAKLI